MKSFLPWLALLFTVALIACGDDASPPDPPGASCEGSAPLGCEETVDNADDCSSLGEVCGGICGASFDCCYCGSDGQWQVLFTDCPACIDAGSIDAGSIDAGDIDAGDIDAGDIDAL